MTFLRTTAPPVPSWGPRPEPPERDGRRSRRPVPTAVLAALAAAVTIALRLIAVDRSGDVFVDELIYTELGRSAGDGGFPRTEEGLFFLHPPGFFYLQAGWVRLIGLDVDVLSEVHGVRVLNALLAGATAALLVLLVARVRSRAAGLIAGLVFAVDQYCIRQNDRALLETETMVWVLAGYLVLVSLARSELPRRADGAALLAGLFFGLAIMTKDHAALITLLPLLVALALNWGPPRRLVAVTLATAAVPYTVYLLLVTAFGHLDEFWYAKTIGLQRLLGIVQETGFNAPGAPSLMGRLTAQLPDYTVSYVLLALTPLALVLLLRRRDPVHRLLALFHASAIVTLLYAFALGTLEEQALYLLFVPNLMALAVTLPLPSRSAVSRRRAVVAGVCAAFLACAVIAPAAVYAKERGQADDGFVQLRNYVTENVPRGTAIATVDGGTSKGVSYYALKDRYRLDHWVSEGDRSFQRVEYLIVPWKVIEQGYGNSSLAEVERLTESGTLLFSFEGDMYGTLALYRIPLPPGTEPSADPGRGS
ncbi:phospholipid carrier-dependent glycosyltransferase [Streptomyces sp. Je 1-79]|uniref:ArnT family glycosyltransferase n=1 Tax=Streptomyces sp. Je 1-79 TaxID=2943847 RepID=UPI0021A5682E|nr:phospholipid carrier-dependent glycosyltransferase [Streptomyces sp. Je 1-79]MCT4354021.1 phospholipid carrier-dependent glycosyltransferase [Streptomyces sp. Je 1-79]